MIWTPERIKHLRLRLGWSQSDLARRLHCESQVVSQWEDGTLSSFDKFQQELMFIEQQADIQAEQVLQEPLAEKLLDENLLGQVDLSAVKRHFSDNN